MKNLLKFFGIIALAAIIGFSMIACDGDSGDDDDDDKVIPGSLTVTNIPSDFKQLNYWIVGMGADLATDEQFLAAANYADEKITGTKITGTSATLNVWKIVGDDLASFNEGNNNDVIFVFFVVDKSSLNESETLEYISFVDKIFNSQLPGSFPTSLMDFGAAMVDFKNGTGTITNWITALGEV
ncbi:MAG: hypothetical protein LBH44_13150 [Treponema sp.]|jgi:hypothetical protein|nr:hypothetical protein [Treponema sp.]